MLMNKKPIYHFIAPNFILTKESLTNAALSIQPKGFKLFSYHNYRLGYRDALLKVASFLPDMSQTETEKERIDVVNLDKYGIRGISEKKLIYTVYALIDRYCGILMDIPKKVPGEMYNKAIKALEEIERRFNVVSTFLDKLALVDEELYNDNIG